MDHIIFSTLDHHGLEGDPRVTLVFLPKEQRVHVAYSRGNLHFSEALSEESVDVSSAIPCVLRFLHRLWSETRPDVPIPDALKAV
jgi:hypothetical protein